MQQRDSFTFDGIQISVNAVPSSSTHGLFVWPGALELSRFIVKNGGLFRGKRVIELGCGPGVTGITIAKTSSPSFVLCTDGDAEVIPMIRQTIKETLQELSLSSSQSLEDEWQLGLPGGNSEDAEILESRVGEQSAPFLASLQAQKRGVRLDCALLEWGNEHHINEAGESSFDIVIGSDLVYDDCVHPLFDCVRYDYVFRQFLVAIAVVTVFLL